MRLVDCFIKILGYATSLVSGVLDPWPPYDTVSSEIHGLLETAEADAVRGGFSYQEIDRAKFAVCAFVDEFILLSSWPEAETWATATLQKEFYYTANAGNEFFDLLGDSNPNVREVYTNCLALGFKGRYFHPTQQAELEKITQTNLDLLLGPGASHLDLGRRRMFPWAYAGEGQGVRMWRRWSWTTLLFILAPPAVLALMYAFYYFFLNWSIYDFYY